MLIIPLHYSFLDIRAVVSTEESRKQSTTNRQRTTFIFLVPGEINIKIYHPSLLYMSSITVYPVILIPSACHWLAALPECDDSVLSRRK